MSVKTNMLVMCISHCIMVWMVWLKCDHGSPWCGR